MADKTKNGSSLKAKLKKVKMPPAKSKPEVSDLIGERLRSFYDDVAKQPIPDRFLDLLSQLHAASTPDKKI